MKDINKLTVGEVTKLLNDGDLVLEVEEVISEGKDHKHTYKFSTLEIVEGVQHIMVWTCPCGWIGTFK